MSPHLFVYYETADSIAAEHARFLVEGGKTWSLDNRWSVRLDPPHHAKMEPHVHIMYRGDDACILQRDGTPSHGTARDAVPTWVFDKIRNRGLIEGHVILASAGETARFILPANLIRQAEYRARWFDLLEPIVHKRLMSFRDFLRRRW